ncbi:MAG: hypothetical protein GEV10_13525 [Streptosporangiales bacterium]|nr:hypothetical protein [Streptosporangiales bacterium]
MARKKTRAGFAVLVVSTLVAVMLWVNGETFWFGVFFLVYVPTLVALWFAFFTKTNCGVITATRGRPCKNPVRGRLRGCRIHSREKWAVQLARIGITSPASRLGHRVARQRGPEPAASSRETTGPDREKTLSTERPVKETVTFVCTVLGTAATIVSTGVGVVGIL